MTIHEPGRHVRTTGNRSIVIMGGGATALVVALLGWILWPSALPDPNGDPIALAQFVATSRYEKLPEEQKRVYMKRMRSDLDEIAAGRLDGRLTQEEYEAAYLNVKLERRLGDMEDYYALPAAARQQALVAKYVRKSQSSDQLSETEVATPRQPDGDAEEQYFDERAARWLPEQRAKWEEFRVAVKQAKKSASTIASKG